MSFSFAIIHNHHYLKRITEKICLKIYFHLMNIKVFSLFLGYVLSLLLFSKNFAIWVYIFPNRKDITKRLIIPNIIVMADIPASFGP